MTTPSSHGHVASGVELPSGHTGSTYFHEVLLRAVRAFPEALKSAGFPDDPRIFKQRYAELVPRFEAARIAHHARAEIARFVCLEAERGLRFVKGDHEEVFDDVLARRAEPLAIETVTPKRAPGLELEVRHRGRRYRRSEVLDLVRTWHAKHWLTDECERAFTRLLKRTNDGAQKLSLEGQRFVLLGAAAELAPTDLLLEAGADVLWLDIREPTPDRLMADGMAGTLSFARGGADLLSSPMQIAETIRVFAEKGPVHVWLYAYAGGESQEWRLTASMNAIVRALEPEIVASLAMLISPTTASAVQKEDVRAQADRREHAPTWKRALVRTGRLEPALVGMSGAEVARAIVPTQGVSYQAAQYVGKILAAEAYAVFGNRLSEEAPTPLTVSANVAPITATRSLSHPVFEAAFLGAPLFDIEISKPETTRALCGLLAVNDVIDPEAKCAKKLVYERPEERARAVFLQQIHGGVYANPYALEGAIQVAAVRGLTMKPQLVTGLFR